MTSQVAKMRLGVKSIRQVKRQRYCNVTVALVAGCFVLLIDDIK